MKTLTTSQYIGTNAYKKSNTLILSKTTPTLLANKLLMICTMQVENNKGSLKSVIPGTVLRQLFNNKDSGSFYERVKKACIGKGSLLDYRAICMDDDTEKFAVYNLITGAEFENGTLTVIFNPDTANLLIGLKKDYTVLDADEMMSLKSNYSWKLVELFCREKGLQEWLSEKDYLDIIDDKYEFTANLTELKLMMGIIDANSDPKIVKALQKGKDMEDIEDFDTSSMKDFPNFRRNVLENAKEEIEEKTSLRFDYEFIKSGYGGKVTDIRFIIYRPVKNDKKRSKKSEVVDNTDDLIDELRDFIEEKLPTKDLRAVLEASNGDIDKIKNAYEIAKSSNTDINNLTGFLLCAIKNDYKPKKRKPARKKRENFSNFEERNDNFDDFVKTLTNKR